uniref:Large ribosomal subunit protein uL30m n=1 Tax=Equus caballus TaxID=9796 RepID=A0A9L0RZN4_HORSE
DWRIVAREQERSRSDSIVGTRKKRKLILAFFYIVLLKTVTKGVESFICTNWIRHKFTRSRIPDKVFQPSPADHEKYGGDPQHPHKLHIVTRIKSTKRRPYWEKDIIKMLGLEKAHTPQVHKNIPSVNAKLKVVKHLIRIKPLRLPQGLPAEEDMSSTCLKSTGELVVGWRLSPVDQETIKS